MQVVWFSELVFQMDLRCGKGRGCVVHGALCPLGRFVYWDPVWPSDSCLQWDSVDPQARIGFGSFQSIVQDVWFSVLVFQIDLGCGVG